VTSAIVEQDEGSFLSVLEFLQVLCRYTKIHAAIRQKPRDTDAGGSPVIKQVSEIDVPHVQEWAQAIEGGARRSGMQDDEVKMPQYFTVLLIANEMAIRDTICANLPPTLTKPDGVAIHRGGAVEHRH
jgi:hypothetical protein